MSPAKESSPGSRQGPIVLVSSTERVRSDVPLTGAAPAQKGTATVEVGKEGMEPKATPWRTSTRDSGKGSKALPPEQPKVLPPSILEKTAERPHVSPGTTGLQQVNANAPVPEPAGSRAVIASSVSPAGGSVSSGAFEPRKQDFSASRIPAAVDPRGDVYQLAQYVKPVTGPRPVVSPYLNLFRRGNSPGFNYFTLVRPELELRQSIGQLQQQVTDLPMQLGAPGQEQG
jgi:hypothetical protein